MNRPRYDLVRVATATGLFQTVHQPPTHTQSLNLCFVVLVRMKRTDLLSHHWTFHLRYHQHCFQRYC